MLAGALVIDSIGNGQFLPLSLVYSVRLTPVPLPLPWAGLALLDLAALVSLLVLERRLPPGSLRSTAGGRWTGSRLPRSSRNQLPANGSEAP